MAELSPAFPPHVDIERVASAAHGRRGSVRQFPPNKCTVRKAKRKFLTSSCFLGQSKFCRMPLNADLSRSNRNLKNEKTVGNLARKNVGGTVMVGAKHQFLQ
jgi:hypothetical protein